MNIPDKVIAMGKNATWLYAYLSLLQKEKKTEPLRATSERTEIPMQVMRTLLRKFKENNLLTQEQHKTNTKVTQKKVVNTDENQVVENCTNTRLTQEQHKTNTKSVQNEAFSLSPTSPFSSSLNPTTTPIEEKKVKKEEPPPSSSRFSPPSVDDVRSYLQEKGITDVDAEQFVSFYESKGWMIGKNKMKKWTAAIATWRRRSQTTQNYEADRKPHTQTADRDSIAALIARKLSIGTGC